MLQIAAIRDNIEQVKNLFKIKNFKELDLVDKVVKLDEDRRKTQHQLDEQLSESKKIAKSIGALYQSGKQDEANVLRDKTTALKESNKQLEESLNSIERELHDTMVQLPNIPHESVPPGNSDEDNVSIRESGEIPTLYEGAKPHWKLLEDYDLMSLDLGSKITGAGFPVFMGRGAKLQRALVAYFLDTAIEAGYKEVIPPLLVNEATAYATGQLPDKEGQMYHVANDGLYLIPTAEVPVTNIYRDTIVAKGDFPIKLTGHSQCFRREAGSYGAHVRGLNRVHQFEKVEIVQIVEPSKSYEVLDEMVAYVEKIVQSLGLPYRILRLCGGDLSFASALTYDFEVFTAAQNRWLEVSSVSNFVTFQSNRLKVRYKGEDGKNQLCHTLNGSALALPRIIAALLENNQTKDGIVIPEVLRPYTGFDIIS